MPVNFDCHLKGDYTLTYCYLVYFIFSGIWCGEVKHSIETKGFFIDFNGCYPLV